MYKDIESTLKHKTLTVWTKHVWRAVVYKQQTEHTSTIMTCEKKQAQISDRRCHPGLAPAILRTPHLVNTEKNERKNEARIPKPHAYLQIMPIASAKFQTNWPYLQTRPKGFAKFQTHWPYLQTIHKSICKCLKPTGHIFRPCPKHLQSF